MLNYVMSDLLCSLTLFMLTFVACLCSLLLHVYAFPHMTLNRQCACVHCMDILSCTIGTEYLPIWQPLLWLVECESPQYTGISNKYDPITNRYSPVMVFSSFWSSYISVWLQSFNWTLQRSYLPELLDEGRYEAINVLVVRCLYLCRNVCIVRLSCSSTCYGL